jgi:hypothetical protein
MGARCRFELFIDVAPKLALPEEERVAELVHQQVYRPSNVVLCGVVLAEAVRTKVDSPRERAIWQAVPALPAKAVQLRLSMDLFVGFDQCRPW